MARSSDTKVGAAGGGADPEQTESNRRDPDGGKPRPYRPTTANVGDRIWRCGGNEDGVTGERMVGIRRSRGRRVLGEKRGLDGRRRRGSGRRGRTGRRR